MLNGNLKHITVGEELWIPPRNFDNSQIIEKLCGTLINGELINPPSISSESKTILVFCKFMLIDLYHDFLESHSGKKINHQGGKGSLFTPHITKLKHKGADRYLIRMGLAYFFEKEDLPSEIINRYLELFEEEIGTDQTVDSFLKKAKPWMYETYCVKANKFFYLSQQVVKKKFNDIQSLIRISPHVQNTNSTDTNDTNSTDTNDSIEQPEPDPTLEESANTRKKIEETIIFENKTRLYKANTYEEVKEYSIPLVELKDWIILHAGRPYDETEIYNMDNMKKKY